VSTPPTSATLDDIVAEATRILDAARAQGVLVRLIGGIAVHLRSGTAVPAPLQRTYGDIDLVAERGSARKVVSLLEGLGYAADRRFNAGNANRRLLFRDVARERQVDVFVGSFEMCHEIPVAERLDREGTTVPAAELLLTKLQVVRLNEKDRRDAEALLLTHEVSDHDGPGHLNGRRVAELLGADWGLWRTTQLNIARIRDGSGGDGLSAAEGTLLDGRLDALARLVEDEPKTRAWRLRARVGDRRKWYQEPEEVE
jgi:Uncharacterised nucleotidyltransferase